MPHRNKVKDSDPYFEIDAVTRQIKNLSTTKTTVIQYDHNSERFTFSLPRHIESHDMAESTKAEVHYTTKDAQGVYTIKDLRIDEKDEAKVKCTWLLSQNVTKTPGAIRFLLRFSCIDAEGNIEYAWNTAPFVGVAVTEGIYNTEAIVEQYPDVLEQLKNEVVKDLGIISSSELDKITEPGIYAYGGTLNAYYVLSVYADLENGIYRQRKFDLEGSMIREGYSTQSGKIEWSDWIHNGGFDDIPTSLSDLEDDLNIQEKIDNKLDRGWKKLGEEIITADDVKDGSKKIELAIEYKDLSQVTELMAVIRIPKSTLNTTDGCYMVGLSESPETYPDISHGYIFAENGLAGGKLSASSFTDIMIHSIFIGGEYLYSELIRDIYGNYKGTAFGGMSHIYTDNPSMARSNYPVKMIDNGVKKTTYWFIANNLAQNSPFYLPANTVLTLYGK